MKTQRKHGFTIVELVVVIAVIAILAAVLIPTFVSIIKKANNSAYLQERTSQQIADLAEKVENQNYLTWEDFEAVLARELAKVGSPDTEAIENAIKVALAERAGSDNGLSEAQVQKIINEAMSGQLTTAQVQAIVEQSIKNAGLSVGTSGGVTAAQVQSIVSAAIANIPTQTGVTPAMVQSAVASALANAQVNVSDQAIENALKAFGVSTLTEEQIVAIATQIATEVSEKTGNEKIVATLNIRAAGNEKATLYDTFVAMSISDPTTAVKSITAGETILWDSVEKKFVLYKNGAPTGARYWTVSDSISDIWSTYYTGTASTISTTMGFDAGTTTSVTSVTYTNTGSAQEVDVVIRTNGGSLTIDAASDTVNHYGYVEVLDVQAIACASYHEYGTAGFARIKQGHFVVESEGIVNVLYATGTKTGDTKVIVDNNNGIIGKAYATNESIANYDTDGETPKQDGNVVLIKDESVTSQVIAAVTVEDIAEELSNPSSSVIDDLQDAVAKGSFRGEGSEQNPYLISNVQELVTFRNLINGDSTNAQYRDKFYKLEKNIDLGNEEWTPIGIIKDGTNTYTTYKPFTGYFDGNHKSISGIKITNSASGEGTGFFGDISENATIVDLTITVDINIPEGTVVAGLVGCYDVYANSQYYNDNTLSYNSVISGITVNGNIVAKKKVAGVIAYNYGEDEGKNLEVVQSYLSCTNNANVTGTRVGGIASVISGQFRKDQKHNTYHRVIVKGCINNGVITNNGSEYGGGIVAQICAPGNYEFEDLTNNTSLVGNSTYGIIGKSLIPQSTVGDIDANAHLDFELNNYLSKPIPGYDVYGGNNLDNIGLTIGGALYAYSRVRQDDLFMSDSEWRITIGEKHYMTAEGSGINSLNDLIEQVSHRSNNPNATDFANILTQNGYSYTEIDGNTIKGITKNN